MTSIIDTQLPVGTCLPECNIPMVINGDCNVEVLVTCPDGFELGGDDFVHVICGDPLFITGGIKKRRLQTVDDDNEEDQQHDPMVNSFMQWRALQQGSAAAKKKSGQQTRGRKLQPSGKSSNSGSSGKSSNSAPSVLPVSDMFTIAYEIGDNCFNTGVHDTNGETNFSCAVDEGEVTISFSPSGVTDDGERRLEGHAASPYHHHLNIPKQRHRRKLKSSSNAVNAVQCTSEGGGGKVIEEKIFLEKAGTPVVDNTPGTVVEPLN